MRSTTLEIRLWYLSDTECLHSGRLQLSGFVWSWCCSGRCNGFPRYSRPGCFSALQQRDEVRIASCTWILASTNDQHTSGAKRWSCQLSGGVRELLQRFIVQEHRTCRLGRSSRDEGCYRVRPLASMSANSMYINARQRASVISYLFARGVRLVGEVGQRFDGSAWLARCPTNTSCKRR